LSVNAQCWHGAVPLRETTVVILWCATRSNGGTGFRHRGTTAAAGIRDAASGVHGASPRVLFHGACAVARTSAVWHHADGQTKCNGSIRLQKARASRSWRRPFGRALGRCDDARRRRIAGDCGWGVTASLSGGRANRSQALGGCRLTLSGESRRLSRAQGGGRTLERAALRSGRELALDDALSVLVQIMGDGLDADLHRAGGLGGVEILE
jgi:hypothetical protein